ncbi:hypothetical protein TSAR_008193 [Trichomalopsis sarcophagae]|uniref:ATP-dependent DNA helicase n=1 Tax=Trichomalopsis sarcophagae TaxID=543379 RepID=A0A232EIZ6_9HYME|nr:hypothetical protein TSAR_008193 [Trichomalopsis sarcophagae]
MEQNSELQYETLEILDKIIRENNIFAKSYEMMKQEINNQQSLINAGEPEPELQLLFTLKPGTDRRRYNFQQTNEVAAIFTTTADGEIPESYVTIRNKNTKTLQYVSAMDPNVEPWIYPLFYPYGTQGWHQNLQRINKNNDGNNRRVTRLAYTRYKLAIRPDEFNPFILGRRLFQQYVVDAYVKIEKDRIMYCKTHQKEIKADTYQGLNDYLQNSANDINGQVGKTIILPSTFIGSPRHMQQCYQDSMALINSKEIVDKFISTEIPDSQNATLQEIVLKNMIHGPCGSWCQVDGKCSKKFPKEFVNETSMDENGYPHYRRRNTGISTACLAMGLIEDDEEWIRAMEEATVWMMPVQLRRLFVRILIHCQPVSPEKLWDTFKNAMSEDFSRTNELTISDQKAYAHINNLLNMEGRILSDFPTMDQTVQIHGSHNETVSNNETDGATMAQMAELGQQQYVKLNNEQKEIVDTVLHAIDVNDQPRNNCIYIDGPGGSGKTYFYTTLYNLLSSKNVKVCTMAFTGIAATLLPYGKTVHKTFGLPVPMYHDSSSSIKAQSKQGQFLKNADVFIWDEAPMAPRYALEIANRTLQHIMNNNLPFGGKIFILGGDFRLTSSN